MIEQVQVTSPFIGVYTKIQINISNVGTRRESKKVILISSDGTRKALRYNRFLMCLHLNRILRDNESVQVKDKKKPLTPDNLYILEKDGRVNKNFANVSTTDATCEHCKKQIKIPSATFRNSRTKRFFCDLICITKEKEKSKQQKEFLRQKDMLERKKYREEKRNKLYIDTASRVKQPAPNPTKPTPDLAKYLGIGTVINNVSQNSSTGIKTTFANNINIFEEANKKMLFKNNPNITF